MNTREIENLLERYFEGQTTLAEEQILKTFFSGNEVPDELKKHQLLFQYFKQEKLENLSNDDFEQKLSAILATDEKAQAKTRHILAGNRFFYIGSIAAGILLLIGLFFTLRDDVFNKNKANVQLSREEQAYLEARQALLIVSANFNTGIREVERLKVLNRALDNVEIFSKFYQYQTISINPDDFQDQSIKPKKQ
ncbi:MAG: hypothetical protein M0P58_06145 [Bacteroidales bacterium]|jgi:hypothetical protein|nr:hypothetical protein [Bacteroidales bacterium]